MAAKKSVNRIWDPKHECMSVDERTALQNERLRATVKREYENVKVYRERMDAKGVTPDDIKTVEDIKYLPFTNKEDLRTEFPYGLFAAPLKDIVRIQGSSGTTGKPIVAGYTRHDVDVWTEMMARTMPVPKPLPNT